MLQRIFDLLLAITAFVFLLPLFLIVSVILFFTGEGEVIYKQVRIGLDGKRFNVYKFATMLKDSAKMSSGTITVKDDVRVLPFGKILRATKLNETLQLINIINGSMSLVGPRPLTKENWDYYTPEQKRIISSVVPGLTGLGSIYFRDEERFLIGVKDVKKAYAENISPIKGSLEVWYVIHRNIQLYFFIILLTIWAVVFKSSNVPAKIVIYLTKTDI